MDPLAMRNLWFEMREINKRRKPYEGEKFWRHCRKLGYGEPYLGGCGIVSHTAEDYCPNCGEPYFVGVYAPESDGPAS